MCDKNFDPLETNKATAEMRSTSEASAFDSASELDQLPLSNDQMSTGQARGSSEVGLSYAFPSLNPPQPSITTNYPWETFIKPHPRFDASQEQFSSEDGRWCRVSHEAIGEPQSVIEAALHLSPNDDAALDAFLEIAVRGYLTQRELRKLTINLMASTGISSQVAIAKVDAVLDETNNIEKLLVRLCEYLDWFLRTDHVTVNGRLYRYVDYTECRLGGVIFQSHATELLLTGYYALVSEDQLVDEFDDFTAGSIPLYHSWPVVYERILTNYTVPNDFFSHAIKGLNCLNGFFVLEREPLRLVRQDHSPDNRAQYCLPVTMNNSNLREFMISACQALPPGKMCRDFVKFVEEQLPGVALT